MMERGLVAELLDFHARYNAERVAENKSGTFEIKPPTVIMLFVKGGMIPFLEMITQCTPSCIRLLTIEVHFEVYPR
ncbi:Protein of unknown function [Gryllus bimaculatus]|nr:Protein of unknown function [Gryllus bimaculatus]